MAEIDSVAGQIYDVDADRILFRQSTTAFGIKDRSSGIVTPVATPVGFEPRGGFLTSHGAMLATEKPSGGGNVSELRDGSVVDLGSLHTADSLRVAGDFASWNDEQKLFRRNLATAANEQIAANVQSFGADVASNGHVAYFTTSDQVRRYRGPLQDDLLAQASQAQPQDLPLTDGTNVVWRERNPSCCNAPGFGALHAYGPSGAFDLGNTERTSVPQAGFDYRVAGGWIAFTRGDFGSSEIWLRDPAGNETLLTEAGTHRIVGLAPNGETVYETRTGTSDSFVLWRPGEGATAVGVTAPDAGPDGDRGYGDHVLFLGGRWFAVLGGSLRRLVPGDSAAGSRTQITTAPGPDDTPSHVSIPFASTTGDTEFQCKLDQGAYTACTSPAVYSSLPPGPHTFAVRAVVSHGPDEFEDVPAVATWAVDSVPPAVTIASGPDGRTSDATPTFGGAAGNEAEDGGSVTLEIHSGKFANGPLARTITVTRTGATWTAEITPELGEGEYTAVAGQSDTPGNLGLSDPRTFNVDVTPPDAKLAVRPQPVLTNREITFDAGESSDLPNPGGVIVRYEWDLDGDGDFERDTGTDSSTTRSYPTPRELSPAVRVTDGAGLKTVKRIDLTVAPVPPAGLVGVTINDGERFTNDPNVFISPVWPEGASHIFLSNDGGFANAVKAPLKTNMPWRLDSSGAERLPKTVYARFFANGRTFTDDIILDETLPVVILAEITGVEGKLSAAAAQVRTFHLHVKARDRLAGVSRMQITTNRAKPGVARKFKSRVDFRSSKSKIFVRVRDRAKNWSHWKRFQK